MVVSIQPRFAGGDWLKASAVSLGLGLSKSYGSLKHMVVYLGLVRRIRHKPKTPIVLPRPSVRVPDYTKLSLNSAHYPKTRNVCHFVHEFRLLLIS